MIIGIDARFLTHPQPGGFKTYTTNLIQALSQVDDANEYILYLDRAPVAGSLLEQGNFHYRVVDGTMPLVGMPAREQLSLRRRLVSDAPEVVHFPCNTAVYRSGFKQVVTLHDTIQVTTANPLRSVLDTGHLKSWALTAYSRWTILHAVRSAGRIITVSAYEKEQIMKNLRIPAERIAVTHLAPDRVFMPASLATKMRWYSELQQRYGIQDRFILGVGYEPRKNIPLLLAAFALIAREQLDLQLVIVAAEPHRRQVFQQLATQHQLDGRVLVLCALPPVELAKFYNLAEVFVFPSMRESFGLPPLEAMACGVPTVTMNGSSIPEIVGDGALLVDGSDAQTWASAVRQVVADDDLRADLIWRGRRRAATMTWQACARATIEVYRAALEKNVAALR